MPILRDRVVDVCTFNTSGLGDATLSNTAALVPSYQLFSNAYSPGDVFPYCIINTTTPTQWETGYGYLVDATTLRRDSVIDGSSGRGVFVDFNLSEACQVFVTAVSHMLEDSDSGAMLSRMRGQAMP